MDQAKWLKELEKLSLEKQILKNVEEGNPLSPERRRGAVRHARENCQLTERHACWAVERDRTRENIYKFLHISCLNEPILFHDFRSAYLDPTRKTFIFMQFGDSARWTPTC